MSKKNKLKIKKELSYIFSQIADLFLANNNYKRAYNLYLDTLNEDLKRINKSDYVVEKDFTDFIIISVKLYFCALELTVDELEEAETFIKDNLLVFKNILLLEEYEKVLNENLKDYEEMQEQEIKYLKYLEIFKKLFISTKGLS